MMTRTAGEADPRRLFEVDEVRRMADAGVFHDDERFELIEGELVSVPPVPGPRRT